MSGPTWKFWLWQQRDWPYAIFLIVCIIGLIVSSVQFVLFAINHL